MFHIGLARFKVFQAEKSRGLFQVIPVKAFPGYKGFGGVSVSFKNKIFFANL